MIVMIEEAPIWGWDRDRGRVWSRGRRSLGLGPPHQLLHRECHTAGVRGTRPAGRDRRTRDPRRCARHGGTRYTDRSREGVDEFAIEIGADRGERGPDNTPRYAGYRSRPWRGRAGRVGSDRPGTRRWSGRAHASPPRPLLTATPTATSRCTDGAEPAGQGVRWPAGRVRPYNSLWRSPVYSPWTPGSASSCNSGPSWPWPPSSARGC